MRLSRASSSAIRSITRLPWHPFVVLVAFIIGPALANGLELIVTARSFAVGLGAVLALLVVARGVAGDWHRAGLTATALIVLLITKGTTEPVVEALARAGLVVAAVVGSVLLASLVVALWLARRLPRVPGAPSLTTALNLISAILLALVVVNSVSVPPPVAAVDPAVQTTAQVQRPDIYVLLLDGYPRADVLESKWQYENSNFVRALEDRGFAVSDRSRSNYMTTRLAVASVLNMRLAQDLSAVEAIFDDRAHTQLTLRRVISENLVFAQLRSAGYRISATAPGIEVVSLRSADRWMEGPQLSEFEYRLLELTYIAELLPVASPDYLSAEHRGRIEFGLRAVSAAAGEANDRPDFVWGHILSPHMPPVYGANGEPISVPYRDDFFADAGADRDMKSPEFRQAFRGHLTHLNELILETVDAILASEESPPVIVLFSDHGSGADFDFNDQGHSDVDERAANFFAALTPTYPDLFEEEVTPVNLFPKLFNAYLGTDFPLAADETFIVTSEGQLEAVEAGLGSSP